MEEHMFAYEIDPAKGLQRVERPDPEPAPGHVVVRMRAASLNYRDLLVLRGSYGGTAATRIVPISDGAGEVVAVGRGVTRFVVGVRVAGIFMQSWLDGPLREPHWASALGGARDGVLAEQVVLHEDGLVPIPAHLSFAQAATLPCAAVTAWNALFETRRVAVGETVLVQGTGGVSIFALQLARAAGARVIVTSSSDAKLERARALGASATINYRTTPEWGEAARRLTGGRGVDHVVEVGGAGTLDQSLQAVRVGGSVTMVGVLTGGSGQVKTSALLLKNVQLAGIYVGSRAMFESLNRALEEHAIVPVIDKTLPFDGAAAAYRYLESGAHFGKVVIEI
jgi:NADPH:quinone reductase-like Zn-dependent oxidoreductase